MIAMDVRNDAGAPARHLPNRSTVMTFMWFEGVEDCARHYWRGNDRDPDAWEYVDKLSVSHTKDFVKKTLCGREHYRFSDRIDGRPVRIAPNYIVFSTKPHETLVLAVPPVVATAEVAGRPEEWVRTRFGSQLRKLLFSETHRSLRTRNHQRAHRHIRIDLPAAPLFADLRRLCLEYRLRSRRAGGSSFPSGSGLSGRRSRTCG